MLGDVDPEGRPDAPAAARAQRGVTEMLYDSEASLRLIDAALDDLREPGQDRRAAEAGRQALRLGDGAEAHEARLRAYWEVQELLDTVREGRTRIGRSGPGPGLIGAESPGGTRTTRDMDEGLYRALLLVDRLDPSEEGGETDQAALCSQLRTEIVAVLNQLRRGGEVLQQLDTTAGILYGVETRLRQVSAALDPGEPAWTAPDP